MQEIARRAGKWRPSHKKGCQTDPEGTEINRVADGAALEKRSGLCQVVLSRPAVPRFVRKLGTFQTSLCDLMAPCAVQYVSKRLAKTVLVRSFWLPVGIDS